MQGRHEERARSWEIEDKRLWGMERGATGGREEKKKKEKLIRKERRRSDSASLQAGLWHSPRNGQTQRRIDGPAASGQSRQ